MIASRDNSKRIAYLLCFTAFLCNVLFWFDTNHIRSQWANVPPVPTTESASLMTLGDKQFAYRVNGSMLQNLGDTGGRTSMLSDYSYQDLGKWFFLQDSLDPVSNYMPYLAAHYYGATNVAKDLTPVIDYLATVGQRPDREKWRWLGHAVYLARFKQNDLNLALDLANKLAAMDVPGMPAWTNQMPAMILNAQGEKAAALEIMTGILRDQAEKMEPEEANFTRYFICERILTKDEAAITELCQSPY